MTTADLTDPAPPHGPGPGASAPLELWGGVECTVNRVRNRFSDQLARSGHRSRPGDLDRVADLGVRALRFPVLWETTAPGATEDADWRWADAGLARLRERGVRPVVGLVHHGSGPRHTSLVDPAFPEKLAAYARAVAERYPHVEDWTPVNEPLTTARFSGLYGLWYPHGRDAGTFARALVNQVRGVVLAMRAVREVNPDARLIQTDDLGRCWSTPALQGEADFQNERRWLAWDLLCGRVGPGHPMWTYLRGAGVGEADLMWFADHPCPPGVVGVNHYLTSERFLDERTARYPGHPTTTDGPCRHVDVPAVRVLADGPAGVRALLGEASDRYGLPVAVTEAHLGCFREDQVRWLVHVWNEAEAARREGADVRAVTVWSLFGSYDWDSLVTVDAGHYESGVFDLRAPEPRPTALVAVARHLAAGQAPPHPVLGSPGWWQRQSRLLYPPVRVRSEVGRGTRGPSRVPLPVRPLVVTGATGTLGQEFARACAHRGLPVRLLGRAEMDIASPDSVAAALDALRPWAVVNTAGYVRVDEAERDEAACFRENTTGPVTLAAACAARGVGLVTFSSDLVFDGEKGAPYVESDRPNPLGVYGRSKAAAEAGVLDAYPAALVVRTAAFFGPWDDHNAVTMALRDLDAGRAVRAADDAVVSPTYVPDLVHACLDLLVDGESGLWHLAGTSAWTWAELVRRAAEVAGRDPAGIEGCPTSTLGLAAPRPLYSALGSERGWLMPSADDALARYVREATWMAEAEPALAPAA
jgi:dTDP-4-dehydrorhamnose reductase